MKENNMGGNKNLNKSFEALQVLKKYLNLFPNLKLV